MTDLSCTFLGRRLRSPLVCSSSPVTGDLASLRALEDAGAGAVILPSLFEEQIELESLDLHHYLEQGAESYGEATRYFPELTEFNTGPDEYLELVGHARRALSIPVVGSLNGITPGGWTRYARFIEEAGADGLELNLYDIPTDPNQSGQEVEDRLLNLVQEVRQQVTIPLIIKLGAFFTAPANLVQRLSQVGANAVVLFNRFYQPDLDIENLDVQHHLRLSQSNELLTRLHWVAILFGRVPIELAVTGGVHTAQDVLKCIMAGANVAMMTSALIRHGASHLATTLADVRTWMEDHEYQSLTQMHGSLSLSRIPNPSGYERGNYLKVLRRHILSTEANY
jgi:dihydroorotate dehydrogenase (fumarate)